MKRWKYFEKLEDAMGEFLKQYVSWKGPISLVHGGGINQIYGGGEWAVVLDDNVAGPSKGDVFIAHIQKHLTDDILAEQTDRKVICKICGKDVDTIYEETLKKKD